MGMQVLFVEKRKELRKGKKGGNVARVSLTIAK